ncbi:sorbitol dehydrogenase-like isoform X2 [Haliotis rubra]|uniref:sorbitol dehydrogenase-like isoform X1 n=1 Tax=Haliotis rubra TaxID=36100 RepID=UPI001EE60C1E|nr:sorbitol dehydrogenase-like isoform X1 [Haliotis rubra]XP_046576641.1 sorbitol dehydrogenase-like isoform X2 [Haliotis rubra]
MTDVNLTAILYKKDDMRLEDLPVPEPKEGEVQISMANVGICGSDVHYWTHGEIGDFIVKAPMILGHEASGVVSKVGQGVTSLKLGDRVAIEPGVPCRVCKYCKTGRYNLCLDMAFCATPPYHGNLARFYTHAADFCYKLPDHVSTEEGALLEPLSVGVHACNRANIGLGDRVLICGAGPIGLVNLITAKSRGAADVIITDIDEKRLEFARQLGANYTLKVTSRDPRVTAQQIEETLGQPADKTIECSGVASSIRTAIFATASGGCVVLVGLGAADVELPIVNAAVREVDIRGIFRYVNCYPTALSMVASGQVDVKPLITHRFKLEQSLDAFEAAKRGEGVKIMINCERK